MPKKRVHITIPDGVAIDSLHLSRDPQTGHVRFSWTPLEQICAASGIDNSLLRDQDEGNVAGLIIAWYARHLADGGEHIAVLAELTAEAAIEDAIDRESGAGRWTP